MYDKLYHARRPFRREDILVLGQTVYRNASRTFGLLQEDRLRHVWILGKTGTGKSTLLSQLLAQDLQAGRGLALLDPHGDLAAQVLSFVPKNRINQVLLFSPEDRDFPISFNIFRLGKRSHPNPALLSSQVVSVFKKQWADSWGPRLEHILRNAVLAIASDPQATLLFLYRFLTEEDVRRRVVERLSDVVVKQFWVKEFPSYSKSHQGEALSPVLNKLGAFVSQPIIRNIVSQQRSRVDLITLMNTKGILIANLSTGTIGEDASHLLGGLLLSAIQLSAMARPRGEAPFIVYVDEFQNFVTESLPTMLSEARKFGLGLVLAHQYLAQLPPSLQEAVLGNVGSSIVFRVGARDAELLEAEFMPQFTAQDLQNIQQYHVVVRLLVQGKNLHSFLARTFPYAHDQHDPRIIEAITKQSRLQYCKPRSMVEQAISRTIRV